jgi:phosphatidylglycerophosphatase A
MARFIATGLGSGLVPFAPGTAGSLVALLLGWFMYVYGGSTAIWIAFLLTVPIAFFACAKVLTSIKDRDPSWIVIDEWLGQWVCLGIITLFFSLDPGLLFASFVAFRLLDIIKPWPVSWAEHHGPIWWSIHADDLVAGLLAGLILVLVRSLG